MHPAIQHALGHSRKVSFGHPCSRHNRIVSEPCGPVIKPVLYCGCPLCIVQSIYRREAAAACTNSGSRADGRRRANTSGIRPPRGSPANPAAPEQPEPVPARYSRLAVSTKDGQPHCGAPKEAPAALEEAALQRAAAERAAGQRREPLRSLK